VKVPSRSVSITGHGSSSEARLSPYTPTKSKKAAPKAPARPKQGARLASLRIASGLSQDDLARAIGVPQQNIAYWERSEKPPRSDVLPAMARTLGVSVADLLEPTAATVLDAPGRPLSGKLRRVFDRAAELPRRQQEKIAEFVDVYLDRYSKDRQRGENRA